MSTSTTERPMTQGRHLAIMTAARMSLDLANDAQARGLADDLARDVADPDATDREVRAALDALRTLATT